MASQNSRKGISPLIASVLLIAFTLSVAMIANPFFSNTLKDIQSGTSERADTVTRAANLGLEIMSVEFNRSSNELEVVVQNTGEAIDENTNISIGVIGGSVANTEQHNVDLGSQEITTLTVPVDRPYPLDTVQAAMTGYPVTAEKSIKCTPTKGLVGYWTFNEEQTKNGWAIDLSGYGNNGSLENGVTTGVNGRVGEAYRLDGSDDKIKVSHSPSLSVKQGITVTARLYSQQDEVGDWGSLMDKGRWDGNYWLVVNDNGKQQHRVGDSDTNVYTVSNSDLDFRERSQYGMVYNPNTGYHYTVKDGDYSASSNIGDVTPLYTDNQNLEISDSAKPVKGKIDEVRIYNRSLSQPEIQRLYQVRSEGWAVNACKLTG